MSLYSVGVTALNAAQLGLSTTGHNISNVNTDGYHRQTTLQSANTPVLTGAGFIGQGVQVDTVKRVYSQFLENQVLQAQTQSSHFNSYLTSINQIDSIVADSSSGLSPALQDFFAAVNDVATSPQSIPSRQSMLSTASALLSRFQSLDARFAEIRDGVNTQIAGAVSSINSYAQQIAQLNQSIALQSGGSGHAPNDLLDQRDNLVAELNQLVRATVIRQDDGSFNVFIGNGQPLVLGQNAFSLTYSPSPEDPQRYDIGYKAGSGTIQLPSSNISGGLLGGLLEFSAAALDEAQNALGRIAVSLSSTFNAQHALGQDLNGALGGNFFAPLAPTVISSSNNDPASGTLTAVFADVSQLTTSDYRIMFDGTDYRVTDLGSNTTSTVSAAGLATAIPGLTLTPPASVNAGDVFTVQPTRFAARDIALSATINTRTIAAAAPINVEAATTNTGSAQVVDSAITSLPLPALPITLTYDSTSDQFTYGAGPTVVAYTPGVPMTIAGNIEITLTGAPANGDTFTIGANAGGVADNRNALLLAKLQQANTMEGGTTTYQGAYSQFVSQIGNKTAEVQVMARAEENVLTQAKTSQQELSGVNLDEEAANMLRYQQAYQAAGKMLQISTTLFDTLLSLGG